MPGVPAPARRTAVVLVVLCIGAGWKVTAGDHGARAPGGVPDATPIEAQLEALRQF